jgi:putative peptidoglycan binding protein
MNKTTPDFLGVVKDTRTQEEKEFDIMDTELASGQAQVPSYFASQEEASKYVNYFPKLNQLYTSSCMIHGHGLDSIIFDSIKNNRPAIVPAPIYNYRQRLNYPSPGMIQYDVQNLTVKPGLIPFDVLPTPQTEDEANAVVITPDMNNSVVIADGSWVNLTNPTDIDAIAIVTNTFGLAATIILWASESEWSGPVVDVLDPTVTPENAVVQHNVCVLPQSAYKDSTGKRWVAIQDSAWFGGINTRWVSENFISQRIVASDYLIDITSNNRPTEKPTHTFTKTLTFGMTDDVEVTALQKMLQYLGFLATEVNGTPVPYGYYGGMTKSAVLAFQNAHPEEILTPNGLTTGNGYFGPSTMAYMNTLSQ